MSSKNALGRQLGIARSLVRSYFGSAVLASLSAGWLLPLWVGASVYLRSVETERRRLLGIEPPITAFSAIDISSSAFTIAFIWLAIAIFAWTFYTLRRAVRSSIGE